MERSKSILKIKTSLAIGMLLLNINSLIASDSKIELNNRITIKTTQYVTNLETVINSTSLITLNPVIFNQDTDEEEKPKEVKSKKKWYITAGTLIVSSVSAYLLLLDKGNGKAKIPGPPSRPINP